MTSNKLSIVLTLSGAFMLLLMHVATRQVPMQLPAKAEVQVSTDKNMRALPVSSGSRPLLLPPPPAPMAVAVVAAAQTDHVPRTDTTNHLVPALPIAPLAPSSDRPTALVELTPLVPAVRNGDQRGPLEPLSTAEQVEERPLAITPLAPRQESGWEPAIELGSVEMPPVPAAKVAAHVPLRLTPMTPTPLSDPASLPGGSLAEGTQTSAVRRPSTSEVRKPAAASISEGRVLLRMLEHGKGPVIEIAWPESDVERDRLYLMFQRCFGMVVAAMDGEHRLFTSDHGTREPWVPNRDMFSGFAHVSSGRSPDDERGLMARIARLHDTSGAFKPVRIFPRQTDAVLLGGLHELIGERFRTARSIRAIYQFEGNQVLVDRIAVDGAPAPGRISLNGARQNSCRV